MGAFICRRYGKCSFHLTLAESAQIALWMVKRGLVGGRAFASRPLGPSVLDHLRSDLVLSMYVGLSWYIGNNSNLLWSQLAVRLSKSYSKERRRCHYLQNRPFRPPMTVHFLAQAPLSALQMPSGPDLACQVRDGTVMFKILGLYGVQACAFAISLAVSPFGAIFRPLSIKFFSPGLKPCLTMPSNSTWM